MIGWSSLAVELMGFLIPLVFVLAFYVEGAKRGGRLRGLAFAAIPAVMLAFMGPRFVYQIAIRHRLATLTPAEVEQIRVDGRTVPAEQIAPVVEALRGVQSFSMNHGGLGRSVPLEIILSDGDRRVVGAAIYLRGGGAVLSFSRNGWSRSGGWSDGYGYCQDLPSPLAKAGCPIGGLGGGSPCIAPRVPTGRAPR